MKPILLNLPIPIQTERLLIRLPQAGDGSIINKAIIESYDVLKLMMPWAQTIPSVDESEEYARQAAANGVVRRLKDLRYYE